MYKAFYQFTDKPFQLTPDPRFFFQSRGHKRALAYLRYGISQGEGFIIVTGGVGHGKTLLVRTLFDELDDETVLAGQVVTTQVDADDMLRVVASTFGLAHEGVPKGTLLKNLETFLRARAQEGKRVLLVVDEVQNLPERSLEELRMLSNFEMGGRSLLQCFLLGQEEFKATFQSPRLEQLRQRVIAAYHLGPLNAEETREYIEHRLQMVGWKDDPHIADAAYEEIYAFCDGVPRRINGLCDRLLWYSYLEEKHTLDRAEVMAVSDEIRKETMAPEGAVVEPVRRAAVAPSGLGGTPEDLEQRFQALEKAVRELKQKFREEQVLVRKAILLNLDLDDTSTESG